MSEEGRLKCAAMSACFLLCLRRTLSRRLNEDEINDLLEKVKTFIKEILQLSRDITKAGEEIAAVYSSFLTEQAKLLYEVIS